MHERQLAVHNDVSMPRLIAQTTKNKSYLNEIDDSGSEQDDDEYLKIKL
jgi:hypothetical protein